MADFIGESNFLKGKAARSADGLATVTLSSGATIPATMAEGVTPQGEATIVVRPEHARAVKGSDGQLRGKVEDIVYFGTDTTVAIRVDDGTLFNVRQQNTRGGSCGFERGDAVGIVIADDAAQILRD